MSESTRIIRRRDIIKSVATRMEEQYRHYEQVQKLWNGKSKRDTINALIALDLNSCSADDVNSIIGNTSWTRLCCDICGMSAEVLIRIGDEPDYDARWQDVCSHCLADASQVLCKALEEEGA